MRHLVILTSCKSSDLDPLLTSLVKHCIDILETAITSIVNLSLSEGSFPSHFKSAIVYPLLKKPTLATDNPNNYRLLSNLSFLSKVLEKVVATCLQSHINSSDASNHYQSAYRGRGYSPAVASCLRCALFLGFVSPACGPKQGALSHLLHLWTRM